MVLNSPDLSPVDYGLCSRELSDSDFSLDDLKDKKAHLLGEC